MADDHPLVGAAISKLLESDFDVVCFVADGMQVITEIKRDPPDAVVLDISMPNLNGIETAPTSLLDCPELQIDLRDRA